MGSTRPMPMNAMTHAKATAQTARGCFSICSFSLLAQSWRSRSESTATAVASSSGERPEAAMRSATRAALRPRTAASFSRPPWSSRPARRGRRRGAGRAAPSPCDEPVDDAGHRRLAAPVGLREGADRARARARRAGSSAACWRRGGRRCCGVPPGPGARSARRGRCSAAGRSWLLTSTTLHRAPMQCRKAWSVTQNGGRPVPLIRKRPHGSTSESRPSASPCGVSA